MNGKFRRLLVSVCVLSSVTVAAACGSAEPPATAIEDVTEPAATVGATASATAPDATVTAEPTAQPTDAPTVAPTARPTEAPPTDMPPTDLPPTEVPPTEAPPTEAPPTEAPPTEAPPTRAIPVIQLKTPADGTFTEDGSTPQLDATIVDPNYSPEGQRAMAFEVLPRVVDPAKEGAKVNRVQFTVYASEEDFQNNSNPVYQHTEQNAPFCMFRDTDGKCNAVEARSDDQWPESDSGDIAREPFHDGPYILAFSIQAGDENEMFWHSAIDFTLQTEP